MEKYIRQFDNCRQGERPFCTDTCPFHVDVLDFQVKMEKNSYNAAYKTFRNAVGFPDIVAALCPEYCAAVCPRAGIDHAVQLNLLEKTCVARATKKNPTDYNLPVKNRKIGIIGAGISGLACALRLSSKKYNVTIYEKTDRIGGQLWDLLPSEVFLEDIHRQLQFENYALHLNTEIKSIEEIRSEEFEAIYVATGKNGNDFGVVRQVQGQYLTEGSTGVFAGGSLTGKDAMQALADGLNMALAIEIYLKTGKQEYPSIGTPSKVVVDPDKLQKTEAVIPTDNGLFTDEETVAEAKRCVRCQCDACRTYCDLTDFYNKWPLRMRDEVVSTVSSSDSLLHKTPARRYINACTQCKLCGEVCPAGIELGDMMLEARRMLHKQDKMPGAYHQFWLSDMEFSNGELASINKLPPGEAQCSYAFFPGCNLGAADPRYVIEPYKWLLSKNPQVGLLLRCCGVPADWAGNEELHKNEIASLRKEWEQLGKPVLILACPTCLKHFAEYLPDITTISLYEVLDQWGHDWQPVENKQMYSIFDPCSARNVEVLEQAVRHLARQACISLEELPKGDKHGCCGFGGQVYMADQEFVEYVAKKRIALSENPYIAYCINCRDIFKGEGKAVLHILDLLFDINTEDAILPDLSQRRRNRVELKETLLKEIWGEKMEEKMEDCKFNLIINAEMQKKMNKQKILEEDICKVLELAETSKRRTFNPQKGTYTCYRELGYITYWLEYRLQAEKYEIINVYTHRMKIELEGVWNGRKTDSDL